MRKLTPLFFTRVKHKKTTLFTCNNYLQSTEQQELESLMLASLSKTKHKRSHSIVALKSSPQEKRQLFCKTQVLRHRNSRFRSTMNVLGLNTRAPAIAEIKNNLKALQTPYIPNLVGYGFERNRYGVIKKVLIITELIEDSITLKEFIEKNPIETKSAIASAFNIIGKSINDGILHLDCWIGNILTNSKLSQLHLIDLEYCRFNTRSGLSDQLIFSLGYLYGYDLNKHISSNEYFLLLEAWLKENFKSLDSEKIIKGAKATSSNIASRKQRMADF